MKNSILLKHYFFIDYLSIFHIPLLNFKQRQNCKAIIKIFLMVLISNVVIKAQESIGSFSVIKNTTDGVPTTSSTSKLDLYTDRIVIFDKKIVEFPITDFRKIGSDNKKPAFIFNFNNASCMLEFYDENEYKLTIATKKKVETFEGYVSGFNASSNQLIEESPTIQDTPEQTEIEDKSREEIVDALASSIEPYQDPNIYKTRTIYLSEYSEEERKFLDLGYSFTPGADLTGMRSNERAKENEKMKYVAFIIIGLIIIGVLIFMFNQNKESLGREDSMIKSIDENKLKQNLNTNNLDNTSITEIDENTLKQKLG